MGFSIGSLVSDITSAVSDPGKVVGEVANSVLPSNMKAVGEMLGGITDLNAGNPLAALSHLTDALMDLPQLLHSLSGATGGAAGAAKPAGTAAAEPTPPPARTSTTDAPATTPSAKTPAAPASTNGHAPTVTTAKIGNTTVTNIDDGTNTTSVTQRNGQMTVRVTDDKTGQVVAGYSGAASNVSLNAGGEQVTVANRAGGGIVRVDDGTNTTTVDQGWYGRSIATRRDAKPPSLTVSSAGSGTQTTAASTSATAGTSGASSSNASSATGTTKSTTTADSSSDSSKTDGSSSPKSASSADASSPSKSSGSPSASGSSSAAPTDLKSLMALSPDQFMQAVTSGKIPDDVASSQSAMMQVQARMNQITQMNQLVTGMMAAMHQMQMSIIQNIRC